MGKPRSMPERPSHSLVGFGRCGHVLWLEWDVEWPTKKLNDERDRNISALVRSGGRVERLAFGSPELKAAVMCECKPS